MCTRIVILFISFLCIITPAFSEIYETNQANGNTLFADHITMNAHPISLPESNIFSTKNSRQTIIINSDKKKTNTYVRHLLKYRQLMIKQPVNQAPIRYAQEPILLHVHIEPELYSTDKLQVLIDGQKLTTTRQTKIAIRHLARGEHQLLVQIIDMQDTILIKSEPVIIDIHQTIAKHAK